MMKENKIEQFDEMIKLVIKDKGTAPIYNCLLSINDPKNGFAYTGFTGTMDESGSSIVGNYRFRIGSITKTFTASIILQMMEEGVLKMNDRLMDLVNNDTKHILKELHVIGAVDFTNSITIKNLLQHRSGLRDYFSDDKTFFEHLTSFPNQAWNWRSVIEKYFKNGLNKQACFQPDEGFYYSDTNYLLLALIIEELTNDPFHEVLEKRIFKPLRLNDTYLEFYQKEKSIYPTLYPYYSNRHLKKINTSFDWGGGGLVSSANDLDIFIRALVNGDLFSKEATLRTMLFFEEDANQTTSRKRRTLNGIGLQQKTIAGLNFMGHNGAYGSMMFYEPINDISIILSLNQAASLHKAEWLMNKAIEHYIA